MTKNVVINVRLTEMEAHRLTQLAKTHGISRSRIIQDLVRQCTVENMPVVVVTTGAAR